MGFSKKLRWMLPAFGVAIPIMILFLTFLSIPLSAAADMSLTTQQTTSWLLTIYGLAGILSLIFTIYFRQPLLFTANIFILIFVASIAESVAYPELIGASMLAGLIILPVTLLGLTERLAVWIPVPIIFGLLAGAIMPFVLEIFTNLVEIPAPIGGAFLAYLVSLRLFGSRVPAILPALITGLLFTGLTSQFGDASVNFSLPTPTVTAPVFSLKTIVATTPIFIILIIFQANLPSLIFMRIQAYEPHIPTINLISGVSTFFGSWLGPLGISLSLPLTSLVAGEAAGEHQYRHRAVYITGIVSLLIGLLAGLAAILPQMIPITFLRAIAGLSLITVLSNALQRMTAGPLKLAPLLTFTITLSQISFLGFDHFFWALVVGIGVSYFLEYDELKMLQKSHSP